MLNFSVKNWWKVVFFTIFLLQSLFFPPSLFSASSCPQNDPCKDLGTFEKIPCYSNIVNLCAQERESMTSQLMYLTTKIHLTTSKIETVKEKIKSLEEEIKDLDIKIEKLEHSLTQVTSVLLERIVATYKYRDFSVLNLFLGTQRFSDFVNRYKYIQTVQSHDRKLLFQLQNSKENFKDQKILREEKKTELNLAKKQLEKEQNTLAIQKKERELFLETTRNSEIRYRQELEAAKREAQNIEQAASVLSKVGTAKRVSKGEVIGVMGNTGFSTGPHLHFAVYNLRESDLSKFNFNSGYENPFYFLSPKNLPFEANSCDDVSFRQTKTVGSGNWDWPMSNPTISQCFGHTPWSWRYQSGIHNGIDMWDDNDLLVKAVESGNAYFYRGGQVVGNGVFIFHDNGKMTLYWHLQ